MTFIKMEQKDNRLRIPYEISHLKHLFNENDLQNRTVATQHTQARLNVLSQFMHTIGFTESNGEVWRGFTDGKQHISFYLAKQIVEMAHTDGYHVYRFVKRYKTTTDTLCLNQGCYTGYDDEKDIIVSRLKWNEAVKLRIESGVHYGFTQLQVDKKCRCVFDSAGMVQYPAK